MSRNEKLIEKLILRPKNFTYDELRKLVSGLGFVEDSKGRTSGSRVAFYHEQTKMIIRLHKPDPGNELKRYQIDMVIGVLNEMGVI